MLTNRLLRFILPFFIAASANGAVRLPAIIGDNMVLQQGIKVRIWGSANAGERVSVTFAKKTSHIIADAKGRWHMLLGPLKAGGPYELTVKGDNVLTVKTFSSVRCGCARANRTWNGPSSTRRREQGEVLGYADPSTSTAGWSQIELPQQIEAAGLMIDGAIWFRKVVELRASWSGKDLVLNLTSIDDYDVTYFNGAKIGSIGRETPNSYMAPRKYVVPGSLVCSGRNVIAARVFDSAGEGGFSRAGSFSIGPAGAAEPLSLRGTWDYKADNPTVNLYNAAGLPASPFRTDDWPESLRRRAGSLHSCSVQLCVLCVSVVS